MVTALPAVCVAIIDKMFIFLNCAAQHQKFCTWSPAWIQETKIPLPVWHRSITEGFARHFMWCACPPAGHPQKTWAAHSSRGTSSASAPCVPAVQGTAPAMDPHKEPCPSCELPFMVQVGLPASLDTSMCSKASKPSTCFYHSEISWSVFSSYPPKTDIISRKALVHWFYHFVIASPLFTEHRKKPCTVREFQTVTLGI